MLMIFAKEGLIPENKKEEIIQELDELCRMITALSRTLSGGDKKPDKANPVREKATP